MFPIERSLNMAGIDAMSWPVNLRLLLVVAAASFVGCGRLGLGFDEDPALSDATGGMGGRLIGDTGGVASDSGGSGGALGSGGVNGTGGTEGPTFTGLRSNIEWDGAPFSLIQAGGAGGASGNCESDCSPVSEGLILLYDFAEGDGTVTRDSSQMGEPIDLIVPLIDGISWGSSSIILKTPTILESMQAAEKLGPLLAATDAITIEAWIEAANLQQDGPARIVTVSTGGFLRNFMLAQDENTIWVRLRTSATDFNGEPNLVSPGVLTTELTHIVYTRTAEGDEELVLNGLLQAKGARDGTLDNWDQNLKLAVGGELDTPIETRDFQGTIHRIGIYQRALEHDEIAQNYLAGP